MRALSGGPSAPSYSITTPNGDGSGGVDDEEKDPARTRLALVLAVVAKNFRPKSALVERSDAISSRKTCLQQPLNIIIMVIAANNKRDWEKC